MTIRRILILFLCLIVVVGMVEAKNGKKAKTQDVVTPYKIWKTNVAPVIDGKLDKIWLSIPWVWITKYSTGGVNADSLNFQGLTKAMWDDNNLYIIIYNEAPNIYDNPTNAPWNQTANEVYIGAGDTKDPTQRQATDFQWTFSHYFKGMTGMLATAGASATDATHPVDTTGIEWAMWDDNSTTSDTTAGLGGWFFELKVPLANLTIPNVAGTLIGWDLQQDMVNDPTATGRNAQADWWDTTNNNWKETDTWGEAILSADENVGMAKWMLTSTAPTIDGDKDAAYIPLSEQDANYWRFVDNNTSDIPNPTSGNVNVYGLWDANNVYLYFDVNDDNITDIATNPLWNQSAVEWYLGADHGTTYSAQDHQLQIANYLKGQETAVGVPTTVWTNQAKIDSTGCLFIVKDKVAGGYGVEVKMPWTSLALGTDVSLGTTIAYNFGMDYSSNGTGRTGAAQWWDNTNSSWANASIWGDAVLSNAVISVQGKPTVANSFNLNQNYPNPFNPATQIQYTIDKTSKVKLTVYNILGSQVAVLVNATQEPGLKTVTFNASNLSSGVYFYKLEAGSKMMSKKMMLLK